MYLISTATCAFNKQYLKWLYVRMQCSLSILPFPVCRVVSFGAARQGPLIEGKLALSSPYYSLSFSSLLFPLVIFLGDPKFCGECRM